MMFVSLGIGTVIALALIVVVSILTGGAPQTSNALVGSTVKGFDVSGLNGVKHRAPWVTGHAGVLIFFASWCGPCRSEMPKVAAYLRNHDQSPVVVMGVDANDILSAAQAFVRKDGVRFPVIFDPSGNVTTGIFQFGQIPETVFVTAQGVVTKVYYGAIPTKQLISGIKELKAAA